MGWINYVLGYFLVAGHCSLNAEGATTEQRLMDDLFRDYSPVARPVIDPMDSAQVYISLAISKIDDMSIKEEMLRMSGWLTVTWYDERLSWDPDAYEGIEMIVVPPQMVWLPSFTLDNTLDPAIYTREHFELFRISIESDGFMSWEPGGEFLSKCASDVKLYPFDYQVCELRFANWVYTGNLVNLSIADDADETLLEVTAVNGEWDIYKHHMYREDFYYECCPEPYPEIHFELYFRRKSLYYIMNIVIPSIMLSLLVLSVFKLPPESGEKMSMGVTLLLSYSVFLLMVSENVPNTSQGVPIIVTYLIFSMGVTCLAVLVQMVTLYLHHAAHTKPPSGWVQIFTDKINRVHKTESKNLFRKTTKVGAISDPSRTDGMSIIEAMQKNNNMNNSINQESELHTSRKNVNQDDDLLGTLRSVLALLDKHQKRIEDDDSQVALQKKWRQVSLAIDKFCFWLFLVIVIIGLISILLVFPLSNSASGKTLK